jgi:hypothetical protein
MVKSLQSLGISLLFVLSSMMAFSQVGTPQYNNGPQGTSNNVYPLGSTTSNRVQWVCSAGDFTGAFNGFITDLYIMTITATTSTYTNFTVKLKEMPASFTAHTSTVWQTGMTTVFSASSFTMSNTGAQQYYKIPLQTPFMFDPTKSLVVEISQSAYTTGITINQDASVANKRVWGNVTGTAPTGRGTGYARLGIDIMPASGFDLQMDQILEPVVLGLGNNNVKVKVRNARVDTIYNFSLGYQLDNNSPVTVTNITPATPLLTGESYEYTFATPLNIANSGTYTLKAWCYNPNGQGLDDIPTDDTISITTCTGMSGNYTIGGTNPDFPNFSSAATALSTCGVAGPVNFEVRPGTYNEQVVIGEIMGASATSPISFIGDGTSTTELTYNGTSTSNWSTLTLQGADYCTFKHIKITNFGSSYANAVKFMSSADHNTFDSCIMKVTTASNSYTIALLATGSATSYSGYGNNAHFNTITNNLIEGGYYAIRWNGGSSSTDLNFGNKFNNNIVRDFYYYGMYLYRQGEMEAKNNIVTSSGSNTSAYGMMVYYTRAPLIDGNIIKKIQYGIYFYYPNYYFNDPQYYGYCVNNMISEFSNPTYQTGIYAYRAYHTQISNNTIWVDGSYNTSYSYAAINSMYNQNTAIVNNVLISTGGSLVMSLYQPSNCVVDYNLYHYTGSTGNRFYYYNTYYKDFSSWQAQSSYGTHDANSFDMVDPEIRSQSDLHLLPNSEGILGTLVSYPYTDIDGDARCILQSWIGADEPYHAPQSVDFIANDTVCLVTPVTFYNTGLEDEPHYNEWYVNGNFINNDFHLTHSFTTSGLDTIELRMLTCGSSDTLIKYVYVDAPNAAPVSEFMADKNILEVGQTVEIIDISDKCPSSWTWAISPATVYDPLTGQNEASYTLQNASTLTSQNLEVSFNYPGDYSVSLTTANGIGNGPAETKVDYINVKFSADMCGTSSESKAKYGNLYDDGGKDANYASNGFCTYLIMPCTDDIELTFLEFALADESYLRLYDGATNRGTPIWDTERYPMGITGFIDEVGFDTVLKATESGMIYIEFEKGDLTRSGFKLSWEGIGKGSYLPPIAEFDCADTGCVVSTFNYENLSFADPRFSRFTWDFDGDGALDSRDVDGEYNAVFPGIIAQYLTTLTAENCGGIDTFEKTVFLVNPQSKPQGEISANIVAPVRNQDIVTLEFIPDYLSCVDLYEWIITPADYYFENGTNRYSQNPQVVFKTTDSFTITLNGGNSNTPFSNTFTKVKYIVPKEYCSPIVLNLHQDIGISRVMIQDIDNYSDVGVTGYSNFSNTAATSLVVDQTYNITIERNSTFNAMERRVWIDLDNDGLFSAAEQVAFEDSAHTESWTGSLYIPKNAKLGATIMRVGGLYDGAGNNPCGPVKFGEIEDYRIFISPDNTPPVITLYGSNPDTVELGYSYVDPGATAVDNLQGTVPYTVTGFVDTSMVGGYYLTYTACDSLDNCASTKRLVVVSPDMTPPVITLYGGDPLYVNVNTPYNDTSYSAYDLADGDITADVIVTHNVDPYTLGDYNVSYEVTDAAGLSDTKARGVVVTDVAAPDITLNGDDTVYVEIMTPFVDAGATYSDNYWPMNRISYVISGLVDTTKIGAYKVTYSVTDASGNGPNMVERTVIVWDSTAPNPVVNGPDEVVINVNETWVDPGVQVNDNSVSGYSIETTGTFYKYFGTGSEVMTPDSIGLFSIFYKVTDAAGNESDMIARIVRVVDVECPVLTLKGDLFVSIEKWDDYVDAGYMMADNYYDASECEVDTVNNVNIHEPGLYHVIYTATDPSNNNCASVVRMVKVVYNNVSIDEEEEFTMNVYPNPSTAMFNLEVNLPYNEDVVISVTNLLGEEVMVINKGKLNANKFIIDMHNQASGVYILKAQTASETKIERIILNK